MAPKRSLCRKPSCASDESADESAHESAHESSPNHGKGRMVMQHDATKKTSGGNHRYHRKSTETPTSLTYFVEYGGAPFVHKLCAQWSPRPSDGVLSGRPDDRTPWSDLCCKKTVMGCTLDKL